MASDTVKTRSIADRIGPALSSFVSNFGWPRIIISLFILSLFALAPLAEVNVASALSDCFNRFGMNAILVLALVPMVQSGCGLNFGLPVGVLAGLLGSTIAMQITSLGGAAGLIPAGFPMFFFVIALSIPFALLFGWLYGLLLNKVKGDEMIIATYIGWAAVSFMSIMWLIIPFNAPTMIYAFKGSQLRANIAVEGFYEGVLSDFLALRFFPFMSESGDTRHLLVIPTGMILFVALVAALLWVFMRSKQGTAMTAVGSNPIYARASGVNAERMRTLSVMVSCVLGAIGIVVYQQSYGFIQVYNGPMMAAFPAVAALLIGGATVNKASIANVVIGTFLYQSMITMTPKVINSLLKSDMAEVLRIIIANGMILYALTRKSRVTR
jgi:simple sugar transport system permease protein